MLEQLDASHFHPLLGKIYSLQTTDGSTLQVVIDKVEKNPQARNPFADKITREPFSVYVTSTETTKFEGGLCTFELENVGKIEGLHLSRVASLGRDSSKAYYQIVFN